MLARTLEHNARDWQWIVSTRQNVAPPRRLWCGLLFCLVTFFTQSVWAQAPRFAQLPLPAQDAEELPEPEDLPNEVHSMPGINAELEVVHRRSQVIRFKSKIARVHVTDPSVADYVLYSPAEMGVVGTAMGTTTLLIWFEDEPEADPLIYLVTVIRDPGLEEAARIDYGKLEKKLHILFPNSKVYLIPMSSKIIVKGQARDSEEAAWIMQIVRGEIINQTGNIFGPQNYVGGAGLGGSVGGGFGIPGFGTNGNNGRFNAYDWTSSYIVDMLTIPGDFQINLRVRIVELNRSRLRRMGVNLSVAFANGRQILSSSLAGAANNGAAGGAGGLLNGVFEAGDISVLINALGSYGTARILAEPNLTVLSGHDATVLSGGEFAVPTIVGIGGVGGQQTVFRGFGISLLVTPTIIDKDLVRMRIRPEYSELNGSNNSGGIPGLSTRRVDTTVELREGQTIVLAGLLAYRARTQIAGIPWLQGLPVIGPLVFQAKQANEDENELMIMVTPEIVRPMEADEVPPIPGFEVTQPNDKELYHYGRSQGNNDPNYYQLAPYGHGSGVGVPIGYGQFNPQPASPIYSPAPGGVGTGGFSPPGGFESLQGQRYPAAAAPRLGQRPAMGSDRGSVPPQGAAPGRISSPPPRQGVGSLNQLLRGNRGASEAQQAQAQPQSQTYPTQQTDYTPQQGGRY
jgi:pilus assembly protein CpaC